MPLPLAPAELSTELSTVMRGSRRVYHSNARFDLSYRKVYPISPAPGHLGKPRSGVLG